VNFAQQAPPHDAGVERAALAAMLVESKAAEIALADLRPEDFYVPLHRDLFTLFGEMFGAHGEVDLALTENAAKARGLLKGDLHRIGDLLEVQCSPARIEDYTHTLHEMVQARRLWELQNGLAQRLAGNDPYTLTWFEMQSRLIMDAKCKTKAPSCRALAEWLTDPETLNPPARIPTTYRAIDDALDGGFVPGGMYLVVGLTGRGKSTLGSNLARRMAGAGTPTLLVTLEDTAPAAVRRIVAQDARQPLKAVERVRQPGLDARHVHAVNESAARISALPLEIEGEVCELPALEALIRDKARKGTRVVVLDQSSWVSVPDAESLYHEASALSRALKLRAKAEGIVLIVLVQVNRSGALERTAGKPIELHHIRETGRWEQDADGVLILQTVDDTTDPAVLTVDLKKHRHGRKDVSVRLRFTLAQGLIEDDPAYPEALKTGTWEAQKNAAVESGAKWTPERFAEEIIPKDWMQAAGIQALGNRNGLSTNAAKRLIQAAEGMKLCEVRGGTGRKPKEYRHLCVCEETPPIPPNNGASAPVGARGMGTSINKVSKDEATALKATSRRIAKRQVTP